ncbi:acyltransferase family protein [Marilutibacter alkalisoli]|uniref:Acyltransferase family protein n=1 Tax=Marilutibacter alkalisoli TaxID=2591633 RepID=A0A514BRG2_9GAMM|nr:acyltransferase family protein [Lysobacter alkalisoli]QDH69998.1 acyltransferase family protein [Lysobacter alkalisoli]
MQRRHDLDWVRVCAFGLLVLYHVGMYYVSWDWHVKSPDAGTALEPFMMLSSPWRLSLLFLISGVATAFLLGKAQRAATATGSKLRFLGGRSWRLLPPLIFGMLVIVPPQSYYQLVEQLPGGYHEGYLAFYGRYLSAYQGFCGADGGCLILPTWNHLWFVAYLWVYTVALWLLWKAAPRLLEAATGPLSRALTGAGILLWPVLFFAAARVALIGIFDVTHALVDDWYNHVQYFGIFLLGFLIARGDGVWVAMQRFRWIALVLWLCSWWAITAYFGHFVDVAPPHGLRLLMRAAWGLNQWCAIVAILGFAGRLAPGDSPALRYLAQAVFPVYILHQTVIVVLAHHFKAFALPPLAEGPLLVVLTLGLCFAGYELVRRVGWLRPLFGLKPRPSGATVGTSNGMATEER